MKIALTGEQEIDWEAMVCRQSPVMQFMGGLILCGLFGGAPALWWWLEAPTWVIMMCILVALLVVPICLGEVVSAFRKTNWLMAIQANGIWLNLRSFRNRKFAPALTSVFFPWSDLESAAAADGLTQVGLGSMNNARVAYLEIQLRKHVSVDQLRDAITQETKRRTLPAKWMGVESARRSQHVPVSLTDERRLRIAWRGPMDSITPKLASVLKELSRELTIEVEPWPLGISHVETGVSAQTPGSVEPTGQLTEPRQLKELRRKVLDLTLQGQTLQAIKLYRLRTGCGLKDARDYVAKLIEGE